MYPLSVCCTEKINICAACCSSSLTGICLQSYLIHILFRYLHKDLSLIQCSLIIPLIYMPICVFVLTAESLLGHC